MGQQGIEAIYALSPQQQGMLLDSLSGSDARTHIEQNVCHLNGELDRPAMRSLANPNRASSILRTAFVWKNCDDIS